MRLIDADTLRLMKVEECAGHTIEYAAGWKACIEWIKTQPSAQPDAEPVKHGKWFHYEGMITCSECKAEFYDDIMEYMGDDVPKFCPDCGAKMDLG